MLVLLVLLLIGLVPTLSNDWGIDNWPGMVNGATGILFLFILMLINVRISELLTEGKNRLGNTSRLFLGQDVG